MDVIPKLSNWMSNRMFAVVGRILFGMLPLFADSCVCRDGAIPAQEFRLRFENVDSRQYSVTLFLDQNEPDCLLEDGVFVFRTPPMRWGQTELLGFPVDRTSHEKDEIVHVRKEGKVIRSLSLNDLRNLPQDDKGILKLRIESSQ